MAVDHWMTFSTFAEQDHFEYPRKGIYQGVIINANMAAHAPAGLAAFLMEKTASNTRYLIDPLTHAFQHDIGFICGSDGKPKSSISKMAEAYGPPVFDTVGIRPILPEDFSDKRKFNGFVERCINYQKSQLADQMRDSDAAKYLLNPETEFPPYAIVAPYFYLTELTIDEWLPINIEAVQIARMHTQANEKLFASVVIDQGILLDRRLLDEIIQNYSAIDLDGFLIWVDNLDEQNAAIAELEGLLRLTRGLRQQDAREAINLHGGYFSILAAGSLGNGAMSGIAHGPEFGEFRSVVPVGGGIPISRYYVPKLHARVRYREAAAMFRERGWLENSNNFHTNVCNCDECVSVLDGDAGNFVLFGEGTAKNVRRKHGIVTIEFPTRETRLRCLRHYLQRKLREYESATNAPRDVLIKNLEDGVDEYRELVGPNGVAHLRRWLKVFS